MPKPDTHDWMTIVHNGYKVVQRKLKGEHGRYERTYYSGAREVLHEIGTYMDEHELIRACDEMDDLLEVLYSEIGRGMN